MEAIKDLKDLLLHQIQTLYAAENQQLQILPQLIEKAHHKSLKNALTHHVSLTGEQKKRLEEVAHLITEKFSGTAKLDTSYTNKGIAGLAEETNNLLNTQIAEDVMDAAIIACVQKMEHYEISAYGTAVAYATQLHLHKAEDILKETLLEEYDSDDLLTQLATASLNKEAAPEGIPEFEEPQIDTSTGKGGKKGTEHITERNINSPGGRAGTSHRRYPSGESRGH